MPTATAPLGKPAAAKTAGFVKPGLSRQTGAPKEVDEEEESPGLQPVHLGISVLALILAALFTYMTYSTDQTPKRVSDADYFFGQPKATDVGSGSYTSADDDEDSGSSSSDTDDDEEEEE